MIFEIKPSFKSLIQSLHPSIKQVVKEMCSYLIDTATLNFSMWISKSTNSIKVYAIGDEFWCLEKVIIIKKIMRQSESSFPEMIYQTSLCVNVIFRSSVDKIEFLVCHLSSFPKEDNTSARVHCLRDAVRHTKIDNAPKDYFSIGGNNASQTISTEEYLLKTQTYKSSPNFSFITKDGHRVDVIAGNSLVPRYDDKGNIIGVYNNNFCNCELYQTCSIIFEVLFFFTFGILIRLLASLSEQILELFYDIRHESIVFFDDIRHESSNGFSIRKMAFHKNRKLKEVVTYLS